MVRFACRIFAADVCADNRWQVRSAGDATHARVGGVDAAAAVIAANAILFMTMIMMAVVVFVVVAVLVVVVGTFFDT